MQQNYRENITKGKLYLIPTTIAEGSEQNSLPQSVYNSIKKINIFIVENIRTSRRFIKIIDKDRDIDKIIFHEYGKHNKLNLQDDFISYILNGNDIGVISEAGTPCVADPGSKIVDYAHQFNIEVIPISGPSSIILSLMGSGFNGQKFAFNGYLPINKKEREKNIKKLEFLCKKNNQTQIIMETPYRNIKLFESIIKTCSNNTKLCIATNLTHINQKIESKLIKEWKTIIPNIHKKPTIFIISS
tara:strand:+ start:35132 stop:35863 length:732 start_codon:yes stop_codon:yes gene_type:complete